MDCIVGEEKYLNLDMSNYFLVCQWNTDIYLTDFCGSDEKTRNTLSRESIGQCSGRCSIRAVFHGVFLLLIPICIHQWVIFSFKLINTWCIITGGHFFDIWSFFPTSSVVQISLTFLKYRRSIIGYSFSCILQMEEIRGCRTYKWPFFTVLVS